MVIGRFIVGLGVGLASCIVPLYIGELSPTTIRGRLVTINGVAITLGQVVAYSELMPPRICVELTPAIGSVFQHATSGWRWMVGLGALPSIVQLLALAVLPESRQLLDIAFIRNIELTAARILLIRSDLHQTRHIMGKIYPLASDKDLEAKVRAMASAVKHSVAAAEHTPWSERLATLFSVGRNRRALSELCRIPRLTSS
jgi:SP family myo-inositol transporter-like MFS transporter 13